MNDSSSSRPDSLVVSLLGAPEIRWGGRVVAFRTRKELALLCYLVVAEQAQSREHLAALLWPNYDEHRARALLRRSLTFVRQDLAEAGQEATSSLTILEADHDALGREILRIARDAHPALSSDLDVLVEGSRAGRGAQPAPTEVDAVRTVLSRALVAYRGRFMEGVTFTDAPELEAWISERQAYYQHQIEQVLATLAELELSHGRVDEALAVARKWATINPLNETACRLVMGALSVKGDRVEALNVYENLRNRLRKELDLAPSEETVALADRLRASAALMPAYFPERTPDEAPSAWQLPNGTSFASFEIPLVGRDQEFAALIGSCELARSGQPTVVILEGEAGIGKTRLAHDFLGWAAVNGNDVFEGAAFETGSPLPYHVVVDALRSRIAHENAPDDLLPDLWLVELSRLLPELRDRYPDLSEPPSLTGVETAQGRMFEAVAEFTLSLAARAKPGAVVLFLDDVHWADLASRDMISYAVRRWREESAAIVLIMALQTGASTQEPQFQRWLADLERRGTIIRLTLGPLNFDAMLQALSMLASSAEEHDARPVPTDPSRPRDGAPYVELLKRVGQWLYTRSAGQPFYLAEMLRALVDQRILVQQLTSGGATMLRLSERANDVTASLQLVPDTVRGLILNRMAGLGQSAMRLLIAGAVLGDEFSFDLACQVGELDENEALVALDELLKRQLLREAIPRESAAGVRESRYRFSHGLMREVTYTEAGEARRRMYHRRALAAIEGSSVTSAELLHHALSAELPDKVFRYGVAAGDEALAILAPSDAIAHYEVAHTVLTNVVGQSGLSLRQAPAGEQRAWPSPDEIQHLCLQLGRAYEWVGDWARARTTYEGFRALTRQAGATTMEGRVLTRLAWLTWIESWDAAAALRLAVEALHTVESTNDLELLARVHWVLAKLGVAAGEIQPARVHCVRAIDLAKEIELEELVARSQWWLGFIDLVLEKPEACISTLRLAGTLYGQLADAAAKSPSKVSDLAPGAGDTEQFEADYPWISNLSVRAYRSGQAKCLATQGIVEICRGQPRTAVDLARQAIDIAHDLPSGPLPRFVLAMALTEVGEYEEALRLAGSDADSGAKALGRLMAIWTSVMLAHVRHSSFEFARSAELLERALAIAEKLGAGLWSILPMSYLCANRALASDWAGAQEAAIRIMSIRDSTEPRLMPLDFCRHYETEALLRGGQEALAREDAQLFGEHLARSAQNRRFELVHCRMLAKLEHWSGEIEESLIHLRRALFLAREMGLKGEEWQIAATLGEAYRASGDDAAAESQLRYAETIVQDLAGQMSTDTLVRERFLSAALQHLRQH